MDNAVLSQLRKRCPHCRAQMVVDDDVPYMQVKFTCAPCLIVLEVSYSAIHDGMVRTGSCVYYTMIGREVTKLASLSSAGRWCFSCERSLEPTEGARDRELHWEVDFDGADISGVGRIHHVNCANCGNTVTGKKALAINFFVRPERIMRFRDEKIVWDEFGNRMRAIDFKRLMWKCRKFSCEGILTPAGRLAEITHRDQQRHEMSGSDYLTGPDVAVDDFTMANDMRTVTTDNVTDENIMEYRQAAGGRG